MHLYINTQKFCCIGSTLEIELYRKKNAQDNKLRKRLGTHSKQSIRFVQLWGENFPHNKWLFFEESKKERKNELFEWRLEGTNLFNAVVRAPCLLSIRIKGAGRGRYWIDKDTHWRWMLYIKERKREREGGVNTTLATVLDGHWNSGDVISALRLTRSGNELVIHPREFPSFLAEKKKKLWEIEVERVSAICFFFVEENLLKRRLGGEREKGGRRWTAVVAI